MSETSVKPTVDFYPFGDSVGRIESVYCERRIVSLPDEERMIVIVRDRDGRQKIPIDEVRTLVKKIRSAPPPFSICATMDDNGDADNSETLRYQLLWPPRCLKDRLESGAKRLGRSLENALLALAELHEEGIVHGAIVPASFRAAKDDGLLQLVIDPVVISVATKQLDKGSDFDRYRPSWAQGRDVTKKPAVDVYGLAATFALALLPHEDYLDCNGTPKRGDELINSLRKTKVHRGLGKFLARMLEDSEKNEELRGSEFLEKWRAINSRVLLIVAAHKIKVAIVVVLFLLVFGLAVYGWRDARDDLATAETELELSNAKVESLTEKLQTASSRIEELNANATALNTEFAKSKIAQEQLIGELTRLHASSNVAEEPDTDSMEFEESWEQRDQTSVVAAIHSAEDAGDSRSKSLSVKHLTDVYELTDIDVWRQHDSELQQVVTDLLAMPWDTDRYDTVIDRHEALVQAREAWTKFAENRDAKYEDFREHVKNDVRLTEASKAIAQSWHEEFDRSKSYQVSLELLKGASDYPYVESHWYVGDGHYDDEWSTGKPLTQAIKYEGGERIYYLLENDRFYSAANLRTHTFLGPFALWHVNLKSLKNNKVELKLTVRDCPGPPKVLKQQVRKWAPSTKRNDDPPKPVAAAKAGSDPNSNSKSNEPTPIGIKDAVKEAIGGR